jgi:hypothetical protein
VRAQLTTGMLKPEVRPPSVAGRPYWVGLYKDHTGWRWANARCEGSQFMNSTTAQISGQGSLHDAEKASGHRDCALIRGITGRIDKSSCDWAGFQCVCELGAELVPAYSRSMLSSRQVKDEDANRRRMHAVTLFSMALGLPLVLDKRVWHLGQLVLNKARGSTSGDEFAAPSSGTACRAFAVHLAWAMMCIGFVPFIWQCMGLNWDAARLGCWPNYAPVGPIGCLLFLETAPLQHFRFATLVLGVMLVVLSVAIFVLGSPGQLILDPSSEDWLKGKDSWIKEYNMKNTLPPPSRNVAFHVSFLCFWLISAGPLRIPRV